MIRLLFFSAFSQLHSSGQTTLDVGTWSTVRKTEKCFFNLKYPNLIDPSVSSLFTSYVYSIPPGEEDFQKL